MQRNDIFRTARLAGQVTRYHTWPVHREQSVAEHTWQVMRIWAQVFGPIPSEVATYLIWHDAGEIVTGDIPFPFKRLHPDVKDKLDQIEHSVVIAMGGETIVLDKNHYYKVKACELIEMHEFGRVETLMGNSFAKPICDDTWEAFLNLPLSPDCFHKFAKYTRSHWPALTTPGTLILYKYPWE